INGGEGNDVIIFDSSNAESNKVTGGNGNDMIVDTCESDCGNNTLRGGEDEDHIVGGAGNDLITGDEDNDSLYGGDGNDCIDGGEGDDYCNGGNGDDCCVNCESTVSCESTTPGVGACDTNKCGFISDGVCLDGNCPP